jgi:hypothetical protein
MRLIWIIVYLLTIVAAAYKSHANKQPVRKIVETIAVYSVVGMFFIAGIDKLIPPLNSTDAWGGSDTSRLVKIYPSVSQHLIAGLVIVGGLIELLGVWCTLNGYSSGDNTTKRVGVTILSVFTVAATLLMYANPQVGVKKLAVISNINTIGGLLALWS